VPTPAKRRRAVAGAKRAALLRTLHTDLHSLNLRKTAAALARRTKGVSVTALNDPTATEFVTLEATGLTVARHILSAEFF